MSLFPEGAKRQGLAGIASAMPPSFPGREMAALLQGKIFLGQTAALLQMMPM